MKNKTPVLGGVCKSTQGRDKDKYYLIFLIDGEFVLVVDGKYKKVSAPKRKNLKHLYLLPEKNEEIAEKLSKGVKVYDAEVISALKRFNIKSADAEK
ncbi:MAG: KOW domain-containing RNA-binding protein [Clostridiales bacterium]|nr:KOW domain-containing RNA-binding protein [Clostridiales bacterium]